MEKSKNSNSATPTFIKLYVLVLIPVYLAWFLFDPFRNYIISLILLFLSCAFFLLSLGAKQLTPRLYDLSLIPTILFGFVHLAFAISTFPSFEGITIHNAAVYFLTYSHDAIEAQYEGFQLTKIKWGPMYETSSLPGRYGNMGFTYDELTGNVGIVRDFGGRRNLVYTDNGRDSRNYESGLEYNTHMYYSSSQCIEKTSGKWNPCKTYRYTIYQCNMDNMSCAAIPFQYTGVEWVGYLEYNESNSEIDFIIERYPSDAADQVILVYSYGPTPRCYVEGCETLRTP